jgi:hypothetical protein
MASSGYDYHLMVSDNDEMQFDTSAKLWFKIGGIGWGRR